MSDGTEVESISDSGAAEANDSSVAADDAGGGADDSVGSEDAVSSSEESLSVEGSASSGSAEETDLPDDAQATVDEVVESVFDWNGELDSLKAAEWLSQVDGPVRDAVMRGIENKYRNFERGYANAYQKNSSTRKSLDRREQDIRDQEIRVQKWLHGDVDPLSAKQTEIDELKSKQGAVVQALRDEYETALQDMRAAGNVEHEALHKKAQEYERLVAENERQVAAAEQAAEQDAVNQFESWIMTEAPDIAQNEEAFLELCTACAGGIPPDKALRMVRAVHPLPVKAEPEEVPPSVDMMNLGTGAAAGTEQTETRSFDDMMDQMRRDAQADYAGG